MNLSLILLSALVFLSTADVIKHRAATQCVAKTHNCNATLSDLTDGICKVGTYVKQQPLKCRRIACRYCASGQNWREVLCRSWAVRHWCYGDNYPTGPGLYAGNDKNLGNDEGSIDDNSDDEEDGDDDDSDMDDDDDDEEMNDDDEPTGMDNDGEEAQANDSTGGSEPARFDAQDYVKKAQAMKSSPCMYAGSDGKVFIDFSKVQPVSAWTRKCGGLVWRENGNRMLDKQGSGEMCMRFRVPETGRYYMTAISSAPHRSDHNDMWIKLSAGVDLYSVKTNAKTSAGTMYLKGYQNVGGSKKSNMLTSVDHTPHYLLSRTMSVWHIQHVCISGRSSRFAVYALVFVKCSASDCNPRSQFMRDSMSDLSGTVCLE